MLYETSFQQSTELAKSPPCLQEILRLWLRERKGERERERDRERETVYVEREREGREREFQRERGEKREETEELPGTSRNFKEAGSCFFEELR